jgi:hypothetical protein
MTESMHALRLSFYTAYGQFYLVDLDAEYDTASQSFWTEEASKRGLAVGDGVLGIGTASYGHIRAFFQTVDAEPDLPLAPWQRVVEGSIRLTQGRYAVLNCPHRTVQHQADVAPGDYRLRVYGAFLDERVDEDYGDRYFDFYWLILWPSEFTDVQVIKHFDFEAD